MLERVHKAILAAQGWLPFDQFMALVLYEPGLGYYANQQPKFGTMPQSGSDFVTAPELSPLFGATLAKQVAEALAASGTEEVWEFGAGSGALAQQLLTELKRLGCPLKRYNIITRKYFYPLCSQYDCYRHLPSADPRRLPNAHRVASEVLSLPLHGGLSQDDSHRICDAITYSLHHA